MNISSDAHDQHNISLRHTLKRLNDLNPIMAYLIECPHFDSDETNLRRFKSRVHMSELIRILSEIYFIFENKSKFIQEEQLNDVSLRQLSEGANSIFHLFSFGRICIAELHDCLYRVRKCLMKPFDMTMIKYVDNVSARDQNVKPIMTEVILLTSFLFFSLKNFM
jgi:hypothetical protein